MNERPSKPKPAVSPPQPSSWPSSMTRDQRMTPGSLTEGINHIIANYQAVSPAAGSSNASSSHISSGMSVAAHDDSILVKAPLRSHSSGTTLTPAAPVHASSSTKLPGRGKPEITVTLQNSNSSLDFDNQLLASDVLVLDLPGFYAFFSERSGVPLTVLGCLTFSIKFGDYPRQILVISKDSGEEEWIDMKAKIRKIFTYVRENHTKTEFNIWVEIGNRNATVGEDDDDSSCGF
jgi:hypothetical protein